MVRRGLEKRLWRIVVVVWITRRAARLMMMVSMLPKGMVDGSFGFTDGVVVGSCDAGRIRWLWKRSLHLQEKSRV
jgi:hypothetical protein